MNPVQLRWMIALGAALGAGVGLVAGQTPDLPEKAPAWRQPVAEEVRQHVFAWLEAQPVDPAVRTKAAEIWAEPLAGLSGLELLDRVVATLALADSRVQALVDLCARPRQGPVLPAQPWLFDPQTPPLVAHNMRLFYGRWLVHQNLFEEALEQLGDLRPDDVVDPATLLFYQAVAHHQLLGREAGLKVMDRLLDGQQASPVRYAAVARLMREDLDRLQEDSLDHIARRMQDIERRLALGRAGPKVRKIEDGVIESLYKLINELEERQRQQQGAGGSGSTRSSSPAPDSRILGGKGPGEVTKRDIGSRSGWGDLPPKQREQALQEIGREFPSHYREAIEQYFRRLANEGAKGEP